MILALTLCVWIECAAARAMVCEAEEIKKGQPGHLWITKIDPQIPQVSLKAPEILVVQNFLVGTKQSASNFAVIDPQIPGFYPQTIPAPASRNHDPITSLPYYFNPNHHVKDRP